MTKTTTTANSLWAKSQSSMTKLLYPATLQGHTEAVLRAVDVLFGSAIEPTELQTQWLRFFRVEDRDGFLTATRASAAFHDLGKANNGFQSAVRNRLIKHASSQLIRHEHLSGLILLLPEVQRWTETRDDIDWDIVLSAVISHHCKVQQDAGMHSKYGFGQLRLGEQGDSFELLVAEPAFEELLQAIAQSINLPSNNLPRLPRWWYFDPSRASKDDIDLSINSVFMKAARARLSDIEDRIVDERSSSVRSIFKPKQENVRFTRLLHAVRAALICADSAASGLHREGHDLERWIRNVMHVVPPCLGADVKSKIIEKRRHQLVSLKKWDVTKGTDGWSEFQLQCDNLPERSLLIAPCGSGKTLAAWRWIAAQCDNAAQRGDPVRRVVFLYPTRATATEGFRDYVSWAPETEAALVHGTAGFDLEGMFENPNDERKGRDYETEERLFALGLWSKQFIAATVDQFMGFMQYAYRSLVALPVLAQSVVVIDEVHSFDISLFSALRGFLRSFNVPVLCMTASLTQTRLQDLQADGLKLAESNDQDLQTIADAPRYSIEWLAPDAIRETVIAHLKARRRVLWVVNTVARAQQAVRDIVGEVPLSLDGQQLQTIVEAQPVPVFCYHARFRLKDRRDRHQQVVDQFQQARSDPPQPLLAITTQVCEMSLDLDADVLITELAPATALIQRMGRCNRVRQPRSDAGLVFVRDLEPCEHKPYASDELAQAKKFINGLIAQGRVNQQQLEDALAQIEIEREPERANQFLTSGPYALSEPLRDGEEFTTSAILPVDLDEVLKARSQRQPLDPWIVPISKRWRHLDEARDQRLPAHLILAPQGHYSNLIGFVDSAPGEAQEHSNEIA